MLIRIRRSLAGKRRRRLSQSGQAAVESALILPLMVFMILGIIQLTMMHHARLMMEYAAFNACRAGIVWNMDKDYMNRAALISLMPTFAATDTPGLWTNDEHLGRRPGFLQTWGKMKLALEGSQMLSEIIEGIGGEGANLEFIKITVLNPRAADFNSRDELHFDDYLVHPGQQNRNQQLRNATRLTIRLRYLYWMRIPFANWIIHTAWLAGQAGVKLSGPIDSPEIRHGAGPFQYKMKGKLRDGEILFKMKDENPPFAEEGDRKNMFRALMLLGRATGQYFIPMYSTYSMRMQSNPFRNNTDL